MAHTLILLLEGKGRWVSLSSRPAWSSEQAPGQPGIHREALSQKKKKKKKSYFLYECLLACVYVLECMPSACRKKAGEGTGVYATGVTGDYELQCGCWQPNPSGLLQ